MSEFSNILNFFKNNSTFIMKTLITIIFLPFLLISVGNAKELTLVWSDEFNYEGPPNSNKWQYEEGFVRNDEVGYFTKNPKNVRVEDGALVIEAHKETYLTANYTTGSITTRGKKNFKYGRFEVRAKMPYGNGSHVGFWMLGANISQVGWPACGEMDVAEYIGRLPHIIHIYNHYGSSGKTAVTKFILMNPYSNFHIYRMDWDETQIKYFIDNVQIAKFNLDVAGTGSDNPFRKEQSFFLTYALGGWGWDVDDRFLPEKLEIDYVRVYKATTAMPPINLLLLK